MRYLLDTNACIALLNGRPPSLVDRVRRHTSSEFGLPAPVTYELYYGAFKSRYTDRNLGLLDRIAFEVVSFDAADARGGRCDPGRTSKQSDAPWVRLTP